MELNGTFAELKKIALHDYPELIEYYGNRIRNYKVKRTNPLRNSSVRKKVIADINDVNTDLRNKFVARSGVKFVKKDYIKEIAEFVENYNI